MIDFRATPVVECGEPLVEIPKDTFILREPHSYVAAGAPYGDMSPWMLRKSVLESLKRAQADLQKIRPGWKLVITDAYRPNRVQQFMVKREFKIQARIFGFPPDSLSLSQFKKLTPHVYSLWGRANRRPSRPPPHSTGGAVDLTLADEAGREVNMGCPVDENSQRSIPGYFAISNDAMGREAHENRMLLREVMVAAGFRPSNDEFWDFNKGTQFWAYYQRNEHKRPDAVAIYGRADLMSPP